MARNEQRRRPWREDNRLNSSWNVPAVLVRDLRSVKGACRVGGQANHASKEELY